MAAITPDQLKALDFGYLTGADLMQYCPVQLLINLYAANDTSLDNAAQIAYGEMQGQANTKYDIQTELANTGSNRSIFCVKMVAILALRNALGSAAGVSDVIQAHFDWLDKSMLSLRNGQLNLPLKKPVVNTDNTSVYSGYEIIPSTFSTLG